MSVTEQLNITLSAEMAKLVKEKVASGAYLSESAVIHEGLQFLQQRDDSFERWLRDDVAPAYDAHKAGKLKIIPFAEVNDNIEAYMAKQQRHDI